MENERKPEKERKNRKREKERKIKMSFSDLAQKRYSCRQLRDETVPQEEIEKILKAAVAAPTAVNKQPYKIWVLQGKEAVEKVSEATSCIFGASLFFVVGADPKKAWVREYDQKNFAEVDAAIVATHLMLEVDDLGLGTTWVGHFDPAALKKAYPAMEDYDLIAIFPVGYPAEEAKPSPRHAQRDKTVTEKL